MPSPSRASLLSRRQSTANMADDDTGLTQSLSELSLTNQSAPNKSPRLKATSTPLQPPSRRSSMSTSPRPRLPSRSPSNGRDSRASRAGTPPLLRKASMNSLHSGNGAGSTRSVSRRSSAAQILSPTTKNAPFGMPPQEEEKPPVTANSVASNYLKTELEAHHGQVPTLPTETIVILNDAVYGHRFSRPRTSRSALSTIVERPERIKASVLGISAAYVRLGGRHSEGVLPIYPKRDVGALPSIPFRIHKTTRRLPLTSQAVTNVHGTKWMDELKLMCDSAESKLAMGGKELQRPVMSRGLDDGPPQKLHEGDLYLCSESLAAIEGALGAVCEAVDTVFTTGHRRAFVGVRPPGHHCSASYPSGFCWVNNVHVGIMHAALAHGLTHAAIIDFDLHHGDGSQAITWQHNTRAITAPKNASAWRKTSIGYFSLHDINSYPCEMGDEEKVKNASLCIDNAHGQTVWNVHLQSWKTEQDFWQLYESKYIILLEKTRNYLRNQAERFRALNQPPKAAIFFSAGFDASEWESSGMQRHKVNVPTEFYARLTQEVIKLAAEEGLKVDGRVVSVLEGGYSDRALCSGVLSHLSGLVGDQTLTEAHEEQTNGLAFEMGQRIGAVAADTGASKNRSSSSTHQYDPSWWAGIELDKLEHPSGPPSPPRKPRNSTPPTYSSPTQASTAKVAEPIRMRRSLSGLSAAKVIERPPSPPPPEVPWVVATHELSKLLIPTGRQTDSCKSEDLNAEATKARRDRQSSLVGLPPPPEPSSRPTSRMALRERRARAIGPIDEETIDQLPKARRTTVVTPVASPDRPSTRSTPSRPNGLQSVRRTGRRLSGASTALSPAKEESPPAGSDSGASRTASSMSSRTQSGGKLTVKKVRATAATRKDAAPRPARSSPRKVSTPARTKPTTATAQAPRPSTAPGAILDDAAKAMDNITTGMKKIRINLITQAQKEARERARLEAKKATSKAGGMQPGGAPAVQGPLTTPTTETPGLPPALATTVAKSPVQVVAPSLPSPPQPASSSGLRTPIEETSPSTLATPDPRQLALPESSPDVPHVAVQPASDGGDIFIPYQPEGPAHVPVSQQEPLQWLPPNLPTPSANTPVATPSPTKTQNKLFHYTSGIPFAPRPQGNAPKPELDAPTSTAQVKTDDQNPTSVWDIPETP
ncbi:Histone deacetylase HOS3 [Tolypocladium ophioglossoides CBS 100239]|uniref:Histone deacetylase HOS3 n=1 Tax=Tolypocladium ophioglossoides (strain CBS 100239) TaxID=1163406 RepID=A0A0L0NDH3_TOLOC|nr:Histone deacetylase HOS3 [Tolypocladium ophioglossoides CBS 100239]